MDTSYGPLGFEPYDHWRQRLESLEYDPNKTGVAWGLFGAPSQPRQYLRLAFNRSDWEEGIIADMTSQPSISPEEARVTRPDSGPNQRRRKRLTREVVKRRVLAGYLLEEADKLQDTLDELGGPQGSLADIIHTTKALSTREVDKRVRHTLWREFNGERSPIALEPLFNFLANIMTDPAAVLVAVLISAIMMSAFFMIIMTH